MTETKMQLEDWLDDLCVRFIINLPREELESVERICFQIEEAQWFYEDFIRPLDPALPSLSLKAFSLRIFQHCPLMSKWSHFHHLTAFSEFLAYKIRVPVRGAIMLNDDMDEVVLVKGWKKGANWSFPRGKINKDEKDLDCAIREVYEETGFDVREANLIQDEEAVKYIEITMREQHMRLYVFRGVPRDTHFAPRTRKEISKIEWYKLSELPTLNKKKQLDEGLAVANANKFYMVAPFLHALKKWIAQQKRNNTRNEAGLKPVSQVEGYTSTEENGLANGIAAPKVAVPSDLPEVTSGRDASSHIKQLLKIGGPVPAQVQMQGSAPAPPIGGEQSKSNALLELLKNGSQEAVPQILQARNGPVTSSTVTPPGMPPGTQAPHLAPNFFPGFPQQQQHLTSSNFMQQTSMRLQDGSMNSGLHSTLGVNQRSPFTAAGRPELSASPMHLTPVPVSNHYPHSAAPVSAPPRNLLAPFQHTGDPHFTQSMHPAQAQSAAAPPASKLPPPKLNSHSLALLNFFKDNSASPKKSPTATLAAPAEGPQQARKTSQHQDSLLNLFKGPRAVSESPPVELSGHPVSSAPHPEMHILQRSTQRAETPMQTGNRGPSPPTGPAHTTATVSGPLDLPQSATVPKKVPKKALNGPDRRNNSNRREREQTKNQQAYSSVTILSRPQAAKGDGTTIGVNAQPKQSPPPAQSSAPQPQAPEPVKPFQPQILRRSEKTGHENLLSGSPLVTNGDRKPSLSDLQTNAVELAPKSNFDRRPSQTNAQKEALLSLFGKAPTSPVPGSAATGVNSNQRPTTASGLVSPVSSFQFPSSGESLSRRGTPSEVGSHRVASPNNKAFLLGYLQGVAKGNK